MCLLLETIKVCNRTFQNIEFHNRRFNKTRKDLFGINETSDLSHLIAIPDNIDDSVYKCRILYDQKIHKTEFQKYKVKQIRSLRIVISDEIEYPYKYAERVCFERLLKQSGANEILIVKNGFVTDTSFSNIVFNDGDRWYTPLNPLLKGTKREQLLSNKIIIEEEIKLKNLHQFETARLINAMIDLSESLDIPVSEIYQ